MGVHIHERQDILTKFGRGVRYITWTGYLERFFSSKALQISLRQLIRAVSTHLFCS